MKVKFLYICSAVLGFLTIALTVFKYFLEAGNWSFLDAAVPWNSQYNWFGVALNSLNYLVLILPIAMFISLTFIGQKMSKKLIVVTGWVATITLLLEIVMTTISNGFFGTMSNDNWVYTASFSVILISFLTICLIGLSFLTIRNSYRKLSLTGGIINLVIGIPLFIFMVMFFVIGFIPAIYQSLGFLSYIFNEATIFFVIDFQELGAFMLLPYLFVSLLLIQEYRKG